MFEQLVAALSAIAAALTKIANNGGAAGTNTPSAPAGAPAAPAVTVETVRATMKTLMDSKGKDAVVAALASVGAKKLGDVKPEQLAALNAAATKALTEAPAENLFG